MLDAIRAELAEVEARTEKRFAALSEQINCFAHAVLHLAEHISKQGNTAMSATTDAIKADLVTLDATVDAAVANASSVASEAVAAEEADLAAIRTHIEAIGTKVEGMIPAVAAAAAPTASTSTTSTTGADGVAGADDTTLHTS